MDANGVVRMPSGFWRHAGDRTADGSVTHAELVKSIFEGALGRPIADVDLPRYVEALRNGYPMKNIIADILSSDEFRQRYFSPFQVTLPDLTAMLPDRYTRDAHGNMIFKARDDDGIRLMAGLIRKHRYYDSFGIWGPETNRDKRITAALIEALGAKSCLELGCFSGQVIGLLDRAGVEVCGVDVSHRAFLMADAAIHERIRFGNLIDIPFDRQFGAFFAMDVLEHLSPLLLDEHIRTIARLVAADGFVYLNSPMFGTDDVFGTVFPKYVPEWFEVGDAGFWHDMHCDEQGWPVHGHLVWASPAWWEAAFLKHGLVRDRTVERLIHDILSGFFDHEAPARRSLFYLRHAGAPAPDHGSIRQRLEARITPLLA